VTAPLRVFLDSNVLISALIGAADSAPVILVDWLASGRVGPMLTGSCNLKEVERNLARKLPQAIPVWKHFLKNSGLIVVPCRKLRLKDINPKDAPIIAAAVSAKASHFVTGDKRLVEEVKKSTIHSLLLAVSPREMLEAILAQ